MPRGRERVRETRGSLVCDLPVSRFNELLDFTASRWACAYDALRVMSVRGEWMRVSLMRVSSRNAIYI